MTAAPVDGLIALVVSVQREVLSVADLGADDDFYRAGGTSLAAAAVAAELRRVTARDVVPRTVLGNATPRALAAALTSAPLIDTGSAPAAEPAADDGPAPASVQQQVIWFLEQLAPDSHAYTTICEVSLTGPLDVARLRVALDRLVARHGALATSFGTVDGQLTQFPADPAARLEVLDVADRTEVEVSQLVRELGRVHFDPSAPPLVRWTLLRVGPDRHLLIQVEHHFVHDGWSMWILLTELATLYRDVDAGLPAPPPLDGYRRFARRQQAWLAGREARRQLQHWVQTLSPPLEPLRFARDASRPARFSHRGATERIQLSPEAAAAVHGLAASLGVTPFTVLFAAFVVVLGESCDSDDFALGSMLRNRRDDRVAAVVGMFVNTVALAVRGWRDQSFHQLCGTLATQLIAAEDHQEMPFPLVVEALPISADRSRNPVFQVCFSMNDFPRPELDFGDDLAAAVSFPSNGGAKFDLDVVVLPEARGWTLLWRYYSEVLDEEEIRRLDNRYQRFLGDVARTPNRPLSSCRAGAR